MSFMKIEMGNSGMKSGQINYYDAMARGKGS